VEEIRLAAGALMGLGDVAELSVPKVSIVSPASDGGSLSTRTFIPKRVHTSIGVLGAASVAAAAALPGAVGSDLAAAPQGGVRYAIEHPTGALEVEVDLDADTGGVRRTGVVRTARKLFDGVVFPR
jgi:4-oxalomesaconate tautomerase